MFHEGDFVGRQDGGVVVFHTRDATDGEVGEVKKDEGEEDDTAHAHGAGGIGGLHDAVDGIALGAGAAVGKGQQDRHPDVYAHTNKQEQANTPKCRAWQDVVQFVGVGVDHLSSQENLEITQHMPHDEQHQNQSGFCHEDFATDGGFKKTAKCEHSI